jgi:hypothetical protein
VIFIGPALGGAEADFDVLGAGAADVLAGGGEVGPLAQAALSAVTDNATVIVSRWALICTP